MITVLRFVYNEIYVMCGKSPLDAGGKKGQTTTESVFPCKQSGTFGKGREVFEGRAFISHSQLKQRYKQMVQQNRDVYM